MKQVMIDAGVCGMKTRVEAVSEDGMEVQITVQSDCDHITKMMEDMGDTFDAFALCLTKPGTNVLYKYAADEKSFPGHAACPVISGIVKCAEAECNLALPHDVKITFEQVEEP